MRLRKRTIKTETDQFYATFKLKQQLYPKTETLQQKNLKIIAQPKASAVLEQFTDTKIKKTAQRYKYAANKHQSGVFKFSNKARGSTVNLQDLRMSQINTIRQHITALTSKKTNIHKRTLTQPTAMYRQGVQSKQKMVTAQQLAQSDQYAACCLIVDDIYRKMQILREMGYASQKINEWVLSFCETRNPSLQFVFMRNVSKSLYTLKQEYEYLKSSSDAKERLAQQMQRDRQKFEYIEADQLRQFSSYLQEILIQKNRLKAREVQESIIQKMSAELIPKIEQSRYFSFSKKEPLEADNFIYDLAPYEKKYGGFQSFSKINKLRYLQLNKVEQNLKRTYGELLQSQLRKLVRQTTEKSIGMPAQLTTIQL